MFSAEDDVAEARDKGIVAGEVLVVGLEVDLDASLLSIPRVDRVTMTLGGDFEPRVTGRAGKVCGEGRVAEDETSRRMMFERARVVTLSRI